MISEGSANIFWESQLFGVNSLNKLDFYKRVYKKEELPKYIYLYSFFLSSPSSSVGLVISARLKLRQSSRGMIDTPQRLLHVSTRIEKSGLDKLTENLYPGISSSSPPFITMGATASITRSRLRCEQSLNFISTLKVISLPSLDKRAGLLGMICFKRDVATALISSTDAKH